MGIGALRRLVDRGFADHVWTAAVEYGISSERSCPVCANAMVATETSPAVDICKSCRIIWFDPGEFALTPSVPIEAAGPAPPQERLEAFARLQAASIAEQWRNKPHAELGDQLAMIPGALGMPVEEAAPEVDRDPWVTWGVALALSVAVGWVLMEGGGWFTLAASLYFLMIFGDNVEDLLGRGNFALLLFVGACAAWIVYASLTPGTEFIVAIAGGAVSGVVLFYGLRFPQARLRYFRFYRWFSMPAAAATGFWALAQVVGVRKELAGEGAEPFVAHVAGGIVGLWFWFLWRND